MLCWAVRLTSLMVDPWLTVTLAPEMQVKAPHWMAILFYVQLNLRNRSRERSMYSRMVQIINVWKFAKSK
jgi:hypothetical protein